MVKITFVYPDFESIGVEYLMAICKKEGHSVGFVFYNAEDTYLARKLKPDYSEIANKIANTKPDFVAFSCVTNNYKYQLQCAKEIKKIMPNVITIFGGVHTTLLPKYVLENKEVDCVAIDESELSLPLFFKGYSNNKLIKGIVYKKNNKIIGDFVGGDLIDLEVLPFPYKKPFFSVLKEMENKYRIVTSRGCPYSCSYCFNSYLCKLRGKSIFRQRTVDNVINELKWAKSNYHLKYISFLDDCFTSNSEWIIEFCKKYKENINLPFTCISNPFYLDRKKIEVLSSVGCINIQIGIQSLSKKICSEVLNRKSNNSKLVKVLKDLKDFKIMVQVDHMLGIPKDTLELQEKSLLFYNKHRPNLIIIYWLTYYPRIEIKGLKKEYKSYLVGNNSEYYAISLLFNYLPILPKRLVSFLVHSRLYRIFKIKNFVIATAFPRAIQSIFNKNDFRGRSHIIRFISTIINRRKKVKPNSSQP